MLRTVLFQEILEMKPSRLHYSWVVLAGCTLVFFTIAGLSGNVYPVYSPFIMKQYGYSKTQISLIGSLGSLAATFSVFLTTGFYKRFSLRNGILISGLLNAASYVLFGLADSYLFFLAASALKGFSYGLGSMVPISMIIERWFKSKRTLALSIVSAASGLATIGIPSLVTWIIQNYGIHISFFISAAVFAALYLIAWLLIRNDPSELSMTAFEAAEKKDADTDPSESSSFRPLNERWWMLLSLSMLAATCGVTCYSNLSLLSTTEGFRPETVAIVVSVAGASLMTGKLLFGTIATSIGLKKTSFIFGIIGILGLILCCLVHFGAVFLFLGTVFLGLNLSMIVVGSVAWIKDWALPENRAEHVKVFQSLYNLGCLINGLLIGISADCFGGSYIPFYAISSLVTLAFVIVVLSAYRKQE